jgi:hypothetical protein
MPALYVLNLAVASTFVFWPVWFSCRVLNLPKLNPFTIALLVTLPVEAMKLFGGPLVLLDEGLFDPGYQFAVFASNILVASQMIGLVFFLRSCVIIRIDRVLPVNWNVLGPKDLSRGTNFFLALYAIAFCLLASGEFGIINWLVNPREGYQLYRTGQGHWYALSITSLSVSLLLSFLSNPKASAVLWRTPMYLALAYLLGSKMVLLSVFTSTMIFLWFIRWPHLKKLLTVGAPLLFLLLIWNLFLALSDGFEIRSILEYFDYYKNAADYYRAYMNGEIKLYWGEIVGTSLSSYVPRVIWPDKPSVYGVLIINEIFYPGQAELTNTPAFGGAVEQFADFGFPGVVFSGLFSGFALSTAVGSYLIFRRPGLNLQRVTPLTVVMLLVQFVPTFGMYFPGLLYVMLTLLVVQTLRFIRTRQLRRVASRAPAKL